MKKHFLTIFTLLFLVTIIGEFLTYTLFHYAGIVEGFHMETILMVIGIIFPLMVVGSVIYSYKHYSVLNSWINTIGSIWLSLMIYLFMASLIVFFLIIFHYYFDLNIPIKLFSYVLIYLVLILIIYGLINANYPRIVRWNVKSEKLSKDWAGKKIIIISDIHLGNTRGERFLKKIIAKINNEKPDIVFIVGDLIDGPSIPYEKWFKNFDNLKSSLGNIYIEGNHEKYSHEHEKFKSYLPSSLNNMTDKKIIINNTQIIGFDYRNDENGDSIKRRLESLEYNSDQPSIILIHEPNNINALSLNNVSLVLSGHTHNGQSFPWTIIVNHMYKKYTHGVSYTNKTASVTGAGIGTTLLMTRIGTTPEIVVLNIQ